MAAKSKSQVKRVAAQKPEPAKEPQLTFEARVEELMAIDPHTKMSAMRREDAERLAAKEGLKHRGR